MELSEYLSAERGRANRFAARLGVSSAFMSQVAKGSRPAPADLCPAIERECGFHVRRWDLRPRDWHRIWPELIGQVGAPDVEATDAA